MVRFSNSMKCALVLPLGLLALGCSDDADSADAMTADSFVSEVVGEVRKRAASCCSTVGAPLDESAAEKSLMEMWDERKAYPFHQGAASQCLSALRGGSDCDVFEEMPSACDKVFRGSKGLGESCEKTWECAEAEGETSVCTLGYQGDARCTRSVMAGVGNRCDSSPDDTHTAYECEWESQHCSDAKCELRTAIGQSCVGYDCTQDAYCDSSSTCVAKGKTGDPCRYGSECVSNSCGQDGTCGDEADLLRSRCAGF